MTSKSPKLSLTIIAYNEEDYIGGCLESIAQQTVMPDEVIVVDNNCTDRTVEIAQKFPFARIVHEEKQGMIYARNCGFDEAKYDIIARIDADCKLPPDWTSKVHRIMDTHVKEICAASGPAYVHDLPIKAARELLGDFIVKLTYFRASKLMLGHETLFGSNVVLTKLAWQKVRGEVCLNDREVHEDVDLAIHIGYYGNIYYFNDLEVGVAKRAFMEPPKKALWRIRIWPKTVTQHRKLFAQFHSNLSESLSKLSSTKITIGSKKASVKKLKRSAKKDTPL
jgi:glycosyltransferase involved in cell wall biosynthesis